MFDMFKKAFKHFGKNNPNMLAGSIAFFFIYSIGPLLTLLVYGISRLFAGRNLTEKVVNQAEKTMGGNTAQMVQRLFEGAQQGAGVAGILSVLMLLTGGIMLFYMIRKALNKLWEVDEKNEDTGIGKRIRDYFVSLIAMIFSGIFLIALIVKTIFLQGAAEETFVISNNILGILDIILNFLLLTAFFAALFKWLPETNVSWRDVRGGAFLTSILFVAAQYLIGLYLGNKDMTGYGALGTVIAMVIWVYYSSLAFVFGAALTYIYARRKGSLKDEVEKATPGV